MAGRDPIPGLETRGWHARLLQIYRYWLSIHPPHGLPGRRHVDPTAIPLARDGDTVDMIMVHTVLYTSDGDEL